jgi:hypothetical protein
MRPKCPLSQSFFVWQQQQHRHKRPTQDIQQQHKGKRPNKAKGAKKRPNKAKGAKRPNRAKGAKRPNKAKGEKRPKADALNHFPRRQERLELSDELSSQLSPALSFFPKQHSTALCWCLCLCCNMSSQPTPAQVEAQKIREKFSKAFNARAFGMLSDDGTFPRQANSSSQLNSEQYQGYINILQNWGDPEEKNLTPELKQFRSAPGHHIGYHLVKKYEVVAVPSLDGGTERLELRKLDVKAGKGNRVAPMHAIFDAIHEEHVAGGDHGAPNPTHLRLQKKYCNITLKQCQQFSALCPVCNRQNPRIAPKKGAKTPIMSEQFRDRFQVDLIDMSANPQDNIYGITMNWIMTTKDHFSTITHLCCLPRKRPKYVAHELSILFGLLGFPNIFQTDNGKEFTAQEILTFLKELSPTITTVTGRPRKPNDQGSVENMNKLVKRTIQKLEEEDRQQGIKDPNWTRYMGRAMSSINSMEQRGKFRTTAYEAVFGMPYRGTEIHSLEELRECKTLEDRLKLETSPRFAKVARELCDVDDARKALSFEEEVDDYWDESSDDDIPKEKKPRAKPLAKPHAVAKGKSVGPPPPKGWAKRTLLNKEEFNFTYPKLECRQCCFSRTSSFMVIVGEDGYLDSCRKTKRWFETDFIASFAALSAHAAHDESILLVHCQQPNGILTEMDTRKIDDKVKTIISVLHGVSHYSILVINLADCKLEIFDGLGYALETWTDHATNVLKRCRLVSLDATCRWRTPKGEQHLEFRLTGSNPTTWSLCQGKPFYVQLNGFDCGPIACLKIMEIYGVVDDFDLETVTEATIRHVVMDRFAFLLRLHAEDLNVPDYSTQSAQDEVERCIICTEAITDEFLGVDDMPCCRNNCVHKFCLETWAQCSSTCIFCTKSLTYSADSETKPFVSPVKGKDAKLLLELLESVAEPFGKVKAHRKQATNKRKARQDHQAMKMKQWRKDDKSSDCALGAVVCLQMDHRDVSHPRGVLGVVFEISTSGAGGCRIVTEHGIISTGRTSSSVYYVPSDRYLVMASDAILSTKLAEIQTSVLNQSFNADNFAKISMTKAHALAYKEMPGGKHKCKCTKGCSNNCGCAKKKVKCTSACRCNGGCNCSNPFNKT